MNDYYIIYLRKSRQDNEYETVEEVLYKHEKQLQEYAASHFGGRIPEDRIYREVVSGETIDDRPEINKLLKEIQNPICKGVLVIEPQRLTRGDLLDCGTIVHAFRYTNTLVITPTKTYDLEEKYDRKFFEMELTRGNDYLEYTKEILARGREASVRDGNYIGSIPPYGYDRLKDGKDNTLIINPIEAEYVKMIFNMYVNEGIGANTIAQKLNEMGAKPRRSDKFRSTAIRQILTNEVYIGKIRWKHKAVVKVFEDGKVVKKRPRNKDYILIDGKHDAIIDAELFEKAQKRKGKITKEKPDLTLKNIYAGIIKCKKCGYAMAVRHYRKDGVEIRKARYYCRNGVYCTNKSANEEIVNQAILNALQAHLEDFRINISTNNKNAVETHKNIIKGLEKEMAELEEKQEQLYELLESKIYTQKVFIARNNKLAKERERIADALKTARANTPSVEEFEQKYYSLFQALAAIDNPDISAKTKNRLLKEIVDVIYYEKNVSDKSNPNGIGLDASNVELEIILK